MDFGYALMILRNGGRVARNGWNGPGQSICMRVPDANSKMTQPYLYIETATGDLIPWHPSQTDVLAFDWLKV